MSETNTIQKIDWHCPFCEYLHLVDSPLEITEMPDTNTIVRMRCCNRDCKKETMLQTIDCEKQWRWSDS